MKNVGRGLMSVQWGLISTVGGGANFSSVEAMQ